MNPAIFPIILLATVFLTKPLMANDTLELAHELTELHSILDELRLGHSQTTSVNLDHWADAALFAKAAKWALRYEKELKPADAALVEKALAKGRKRAAALKTGKSPWTKRKGKLVCGYVSAVDNSVQPFGLIIPASYDPNKPTRLDVVLHGSKRPGKGLSELQFMRRFDSDDTVDTSPTETNYIELHPLGRVENCYRWAGETDVFEAIHATCRNYNIDRDRIVLRGMSMGASGTWHLGLKHPDRFVALGPYCGYVDTHQFSETPLKNFIKVGPLPVHQESVLHMLDSVDYAANAGVVPAIACIGEKDVFFQAHVIMGKAMAREGLKMVNLISPGTGHTIDPVTHKEQMRRIAIHAKKGIDHAPRQLRFVTWTLKYGRCHWVQLLGLKEHYQRAEVRAHLTENGSIEIDELKNITRFSLKLPSLQKSGTQVKVTGQPVSLPKTNRPEEMVFTLRDGQWVYLGSRESVELAGKRPGLQGPIDDAFTTKFLCVRGTGKPWNHKVQAWSAANLKRFAYEWNRYMRGELSIKDDTEVTEDDVRNSNLILFGDPGSNRWISRVLPKLPIEWTREKLHLGNEEYSSANHAPAFIHPNPLPGAVGRYVVINSGHTFHEKELGSLNYLLFPRHGDWAVFQVGGKVPDNPSDPLEESVLHAGFFNEHWQFPAR